MSADPIIYCLEHISDYRDFERLCSAFLAGVGFPGIDPLGGTGDEGRDAIVRSDDSGRKIGFAYTVRSDWRRKLGQDSKRVHQMGHDPHTFVFVCTTALSASDKDFAHKFIADTYGWGFELFDLERLRVQLVGSQRHLLAQHPSIFIPPFFPQSGGQSIAESRDTILIDHVPVDHAAATWLARRLSLAGFRTWCLGTAPLAGENADETVRKLLDVRAIHYLPVVSYDSLINSDFRERCTIAGAKDNFALPCQIGGIREATLPSRLAKLTPADFSGSWATGLAQVLSRLKALGVKPSFDNDHGRQIALGGYQPTRVTVAKPEPVFANVFPLEVPSSMRITSLQSPLTDERKADLRCRWAFVELNDLTLVSFAPPPGGYLHLARNEHTPEFAWTNVELKEGKRTFDLAKQLIWRSLDVACAQKGLKICTQRGSFYFPKKDSGEWNQSIRHVDGRGTTVQLTGVRTKGYGEHASPFTYQLSPRFRPQRDANARWHVIVNIYIRVTTLDGIVFERKEIGRRRKVVSKSWWNKDWLPRLLGVVQALETSSERIEIGQGSHAVAMSTKPLSWYCPVGLDVQALAGISEIGAEIAQYRTREDDDDEDQSDEASTSPNMEQNS